MDGTLLDSMPYWDKVGLQYLSLMGKTPKEDFNEKMRSMSMPQTAHYFIDVYGVNQNPQQIKQTINDLMEVNYKTKIMPKEGVKTFLKNMYNNGVKMCVASATDKYLIEYALKANDIYDYFDGIFSCTDIGFSKEHPNIYNDALSHINTNKDDTFVFEDALYAAKTAKNAGFKVVGVFDEYSADQKTEISDLSDVFITSFCEIENGIKSLCNSK